MRLISRSCPAHNSQMMPTSGLVYIHACYDELFKHGSARNCRCRALKDLQQSIGGARSKSHMEQQTIKSLKLFSLYYLNSDKKL